MSAIFARDLPDWSFRSAADFIGADRWSEVGDNFIENARIKANFLAERCSGHFVLADDSGLLVEALDGRPGVHSSHYGGIEGDHARNNQRLMTEMAGIADRRARFVCQLCLLTPERSEFLFVGECRGRLIDELKGHKGFGYDPLFIPEGHDQTFAELGEGIKNQLSHRNRALQELRQMLATWAS